MSGAERDVAADGMIAVPADLFGPVDEAVEADAPGYAADEVEATVVVNRNDEFDAVEATVVVDRTGGTPHGELDEATVVVERTGEPPHSGVDEATVVVERTTERSRERSDAGDGSGPSMAHPAASVMHAPTRRSRRTPSRAPVSDEVLNTAEQGPGVGVLERYPSRPAEPLRMPIPDLGEGPAPTRDPARELPSVARRTRRSALIGLGAVALAAVLGAVGVVAIAASVLGPLFG